MDIISQICEKYNGEYQKDEKASNTPKGKVLFQSERGKFEINKNQYEIYASYHGGILQGSDQIQIALSVNNFTKKALRIYPRSTIEKIIDFVTRRRRKEIHQRIKHLYQFEGNKPIIQTLNKDVYFINLLVNHDLVIYLRKDIPNKIVLQPNQRIKKIQQLEDYIKILEIIKKYCD